MPLIDVTDVLLDPDFADVFSVIRRAEVVDPATGRSVITPTTYHDIVGVVTAAAPGDLDRRDDGQMMARKISIVTQYRLRGPGNGFQPDQIVLGEVTFTVTEILPYTRFGGGFIQATAESMSAATPAPI